MVELERRPKLMGIIHELIDSEDIAKGYVTAFVADIDRTGFNYWMIDRTLG